LWNAPLHLGDGFPELSVVSLVTRAALIWYSLERTEEGWGGLGGHSPFPSVPPPCPFLPTFSVDHFFGIFLFSFDDIPFFCACLLPTISCTFLYVSTQKGIFSRRPVGGKGSTGGPCRSYTSSLATRGPRTSPDNADLFQLNETPFHLLSPLYSVPATMISIEIEKVLACSCPFLSKV